MSSNNPLVPVIGAGPAGLAVGVVFPKEYPRYPSRTQVIDYLEAYAKESQLDISCHQQTAIEAKEISRDIVRKKT